MLLDSNLAAIRTVLMSEWDPIGCGVPDDEYDSYIPAIYQLIKFPSEIESLSAYLQEVESQSMGLPARPEACRRVATILLNMRTLGSSSSTPNDSEPTV